jgi:hypothetical protein
MTIQIITAISLRAKCKSTPGDHFEKQKDDEQQEEQSAYPAEADTYVLATIIASSYSASEKNQQNDDQENDSHFPTDLS